MDLQFGENCLHQVPQQEEQSDRGSISPLPATHSLWTASSMAAVAAASARDDRPLPLPWDAALPAARSNDNCCRLCVARGEERRLLVSRCGSLPLQVPLRRGVPHPAT